MMRRREDRAPRRVNCPMRRLHLPSAHRSKLVCNAHRSVLLLGERVGEERVQGLLLACNRGCWGKLSWNALQLRRWSKWSDPPPALLSKKGSLFRRRILSLSVFLAPCMLADRSLHLVDEIVVITMKERVVVGARERPLIALLETVEVQLPLKRRELVVFEVPWKDDTAESVVVKNAERGARIVPRHHRWALRLQYEMKRHGEWSFGHLCLWEVLIDKECIERRSVGRFPNPRS
mmetsp:Transcript_14972/g.25407  ORF Transcript_14972/g.25407 Transcript_14972/m.25407 type:complete len:234 (+) Transcript_14972:33-734(+)